MSEKKNKPETNIAIIGMACRFPGANNYNQFWENLKNGVNSIKEIPPERWDIGKYYSSDINAPNKSISKWCGLVDDFNKFDHRFFNISPREAMHMDPHQRLMLETTWRCIEDAGVPLNNLQRKKTSLYIGTTTIDFAQWSSEHSIAPDGYSVSGSYECMTANRISYVLGLSGTSSPVDAACASSLVALHEAKQALLGGQCDYALAGGVSLHFHFRKYLFFSKAYALSPDGQCKAFDKNANGYVPGEGAGVLLLQPLNSAIKEGNHVYGIIKGSSINHCGKSKSFTAPSVKAQQAVIISSCKNADINPETINYIESHGTGTSLGDPIELEALTKAFEMYTQKKHFCKIGSVKTNIGHLEAAAGIASVIKVLLMFKNKQIPKILNFNDPNPVINFKDSPFIVATELSEWKNIAQKTQLRAGVSSFGFGGVNAHLILEEAQAIFKSQKESNSGNLFLFSAKTEESLTALMTEWKTFVQSEDYAKYSLNDISATLAAGRESFPYRFGCIADTHEELRNIFHAAPNSFSIQEKPLICLRTGEFAWKGWQEVQSLCEDNSFFKQEIETIEAVLEKLSVPKTVSRDFHNKIWPEKNYKLYRFMAGYAFLKSFFKISDIIPNLTAGEAKNSGFWTALTISGIITCEDALSVLSGIKKNSDIKFTRPSIAFFD
ncbi:beta-ketoacyl synthase N-terminal-like domain-containing protein, partial [Desulfobacterales bacterium HSG17]|nr:beta-ketoacyl synthase N-terminal-like domain-containing protein [Desulfobacterales bacterium HSG17]